SPDFFFHLLSSRYVQDQFSLLAAGSVVKNISGDLVKKALLPIPSLEKQNEVVKTFELISDQTQKLETLYRQKLASLNELKRSLLRKAFSGELTSSSVVALRRPVSQQQDVEATSPEFAAHVLAYAHNWHASHQRDRTF